MSAHLTRVDAAVVLAFVQNRFAGDVETLEPLVGGELSAAFAFASGAAKYVARVNWREEGFLKDRFAHKTFNSAVLPIPETHLIDRLNERLFISVTTRVPGKTLDHFGRDETAALMPQVLAALDAVHASSPPGQSGYGWWGRAGAGEDASWRAHLERAFAGTMKHVERVFPAGGADRLFAAEVEDRFHNLLDTCPEMSALVHGDFGYSNLLVDGDRISGVIDWDTSRYGDPLLDVAWLDFFTDEIDYAGIVRAHYEGKGRDVTNFSERLACYSLQFGLDALRFYAEDNRTKAVDMVRRKLTGLLRK